MRRTTLKRTIFDACYLINLDRRKDRLSHAKAEVERAKLVQCLQPQVPLTRISAVDGLTLDVEKLGREGRISPLGLERFRLPVEEKLFGMDLSAGAVGCALSHRLAWQKVVKAQCKAALILEDDVEFHHRFSRELQQRWKDVPSDWGIVYLGGLDLLSAGKPCRPFIKKGVRRAYQGHRELTAYVVHAESAKRCLELSECLTWQIDTHITSIFKDDEVAQDKYISDPMSYVFQPSLAIQVSSFGTDVQKLPSDNPSLEDASRRMREFIGGGTSVR